MDRDAAASTVDVLPPIAWATARKIGLIGLGLAGAAALLGLLANALGGAPAILHTARLVLVFVGAIAAGIAISFRTDLWQAWVIGAGTALLAIAGTPGHWDSFRLVFGVLTGLALFRAGLLVIRPQYRMAIVSAFLVLHFFGILLATTSPDPTPWMVDQLYRRAYEPYLQFVYLRNAYHFYSPEPGPASLMVCFLRTEDGEDVGADGVRRKKYRDEWVITPRRPADVKDPLGVAYYRRISLTDQLQHSNTDNATAASFERSGIRNRRVAFSVTIPLHPDVVESVQYRLPAPVVSRYVLPSYAQHILMDLPEKDRAKTTVKLYRFEHRTLSVYSLIGISNYERKPGNPYYPTTYLPYYLGEFGFVRDASGNTRVELLDPKDGMLYWLVPILDRPGGGVPGDPSKKDYVDYLSVHAGREFDWSKLR